MLPPNLATDCRHAAAMEDSVGFLANLMTCSGSVDLRGIRFQNKWPHCPKSTFNLRGAAGKSHIPSILMTPLITLMVQEPQYFVALAWCIVSHNPHYPLSSFPFTVSYTGHTQSKVHKVRGRLKRNSTLLIPTLKIPFPCKIAWDISIGLQSV